MVSQCIIVLRRWAIIIVVTVSGRLSIVFSMAFSVTESKLLVASSKISTSGFFNRARAIASRCRCPPERFAPFSSKRVSYRVGIFSINSLAQLILQASIISSSGAFSLPNSKLSRIVPLNRNVSWGI